jgi:hypothetical protein
MPKFRRLVWVVLGLSAIAVGVGTISSRPVAAAPLASAPINVKVVNPPAQPVPVSDAQTQPFGILINPVLSDGAIRGDASFTVPSGQRLIIDFVGGNVCLPAGQKAAFDVTVQIGTIESNYVLAAIPQGTFNSLAGCDDFAVSQQVRIYADPNTTVDFGVVRSDSTGRTFAGIGVSGHLVNVQ